MDDRLKHLAQRRNRMPHWVMRDAIKQYIERKEKQDSLLQEALDSLAQYREDGLHLTLDEVSQWLKTWGTDEEKEASQCHV
jgi:predicted transcriptional regulator